MRDYIIVGGRKIEWFPPPEGISLLIAEAVADIQERLGVTTDEQLGDEEQESESCSLEAIHQRLMQAMQKAAQIFGENQERIAKNHLAAVVFGQSKGIAARLVAEKDEE